MRLKYLVLGAAFAGVLCADALGNEGRRTGQSSMCRF